jgi:hypothetical protein
MSTAETISASVRNLLTLAMSEDDDRLTTPPNKLYSRKVKELAAKLGVSEPYMFRKIKDSTWTIGDLDRLAEYFGVHPADLVPGPHDGEEKG